MPNTPSFWDKAINRARSIFARDENVLLLLIAAAILTYCLCLPNQISLELTGAKKLYDSLSY